MDMNRRDFMKMSALTATTAVAGWLLPRNALAAAFERAAAAPGSTVDTASPHSSPAVAFVAGKAISMEECQSLDYKQMASRSSMVQAAWRYLQEEAGKIGDKTLRELVVTIYGDSTPKLAKLVYCT